MPKICPAPADPANPLTDPLVIYTFEFWGVKPDPVGSTDAALNLTKLNDAIEWSSCTGIPIYGLGSSYTFTPSANDSAIFLLDSAQVICAPNCVLTWSRDPAIAAAAGVVTNVVTGGVPSRANRARWSGGQFVGLSINSSYPTSDFFHLVGDDMLLDAISVQGCQGSAFWLQGNGIRLNAPMVNVLDSGPVPTGGGVWFAGGKGFRMSDGRVRTTGAALRISPQDMAAGEVADCAVQGTALVGQTTSVTDSHLIFIETSHGAIRDVRIDSVTCKGADGPGNAVRIVNSNRTSEQAAISNISLRDIAIDWTARTASNTAATLSIRNEIALARAVAGVSLTNISVVDPKGVTLAVSSVITAVENVMWTVGVITGASGAAAPVYAGSCITLNKLTSGVFSDLSIAAGTGGPVVSVSDTLASADIVFRDVSITGLASNATALQLDKATSCGWVRGRIAGVVAAGTTAVNLTTAAAGCYVEGADLSAVGSDTSAPLKITGVTSTNCRLVGNYGSSQRSPVGLGPPVSTPLAPLTATTNQITVTSSYAVVTISTTPVTLDQINGSSEGDLLTLSKSGTATLTVVDGVNLKLAGNCPLAALNDTLTLLRRSADWVEVSRSFNG